MLDKRKFYINGEWVDPIKKNDFDVINPCNEDPFAIISLGSYEDTNKAVNAAKNAFLAELTATSVSSFDPSEITAKGSSFDGFITSKSFVFEGLIHFPLI